MDLHPCSGRIREINEHFNKTTTLASNQEEVRKAREARAYANIMYSPRCDVKVAVQYIRNNDIKRLTQKYSNKCLVFIQLV